MQDLQGYFDNELPQMESLAQQVDQDISRTLQLFANLKPTDEAAAAHGWPYSVASDLDLSEPPHLSQSTASMIVAALVAALFPPTPRYAHGYTSLSAENMTRTDSKCAAGLADHVRIVASALSTKWLSVEEGGVTKQETNCAVSSTFGKNDVLTLSWHLDIFQTQNCANLHLSEDMARRVCVAAKASIQKKLDELAKRPIDKGFSVECFNDSPAYSRNVGDSAYLLLRLVRCQRHLPPQQTQAARNWAFNRFQSTLHSHLAFSEIGGGRFDPSELAFCLEGLLHLRPDAVDDSVAARVLQVIATSQERGAPWRSETPLVASRKGEVLYPISVETATSILSSLSLLDERLASRLSASHGARFLGVITKYWSWLRARRIAVQVERHEVFGWRAEHIASPVIHSWENSQILEFLLIFGDYIRRHTAGRLLEVSGLAAKLVEHRDWADLEKAYEPMLGDSMALYPRIDRDFVAPRVKSTSSAAQWSMLLYGPPGTGKSSLAKNLASTLKVPLIVLTVSDFLAAGAGGIEWRAKQLFQVLQRQPFLVVLFDELDQFLLDRDSSQFRNQDSQFQLLTPGMLTKIADLRDAQNVLFIFATNYEERIDPAIKRTGRIDRRYLVLPPNAARRQTLVTDALSGRVAMDSEALGSLVAKSVFLNAPDIKRVCKQATDGRASLADLADRLDREPRSIQFESYLTRLSNSNGGPVDEVVGLCLMAQEVFDPNQPDVARFARRVGRLFAEPWTSSAALKERREQLGREGSDLDVFFDACK